MVRFVRSSHGTGRIQQLKRFQETKQGLEVELGRQEIENKSDTK